MQTTADLSDMEGELPSHENALPPPTKFSRRSTITSKPFMVSQPLNPDNRPKALRFILAYKAAIAQTQDK